MSPPRSAARLQPAFLSPGRARPQPAVNAACWGHRRRLGTEVDYLLEGGYWRERELALEKGRVLLARGDALRALAALRPACRVDRGPLGTDARLCQCGSAAGRGREKESRETLVREKEVIQAHHDRTAAATPSD